MFLAVALTFSGSGNAITLEKFEQDLDIIQSHYPIIKDLRSEQCFQESAVAFLQKHPKKTSAYILDLCIKKNLKTYIKSMGSEFYFNLVEGLDPVYRDLNPDCGTNGNGFPVKGIFVRTQVFDFVEELGSAFKMNVVPMETDSL